MAVQWEGFDFTDVGRTTKSCRAWVAALRMVATHLQEGSAPAVGARTADVLMRAHSPQKGRFKGP